MVLNQAVGNEASREIYSSGDRKQTLRSNNRTCWQIRRESGKGRIKIFSQNN